MEQYIRYKRFEAKLTVNLLEYQEFLDSLSKEGWQIIYYNEQLIDMFSHRVTVLAGKKQDDVLFPKQVL